MKTSYGASVLIRNESESAQAGGVQEVRAATSRTRCRSPPPIGRRSRASHADGSDGRAVPRRRSAARLPGGRRQSAQRSAHPRRRRAPRRSSSRTSWTRASTMSSCRSPSCSCDRGPGEPGVGRRLSRRRRDARDLSRPRSRVRARRTESRSDIREAIGPHLLRPRGSEGRRRRHVRARLADRPGRAAEGTRARSTTRRTSPASSAPCASAPPRRTAAPR